MFSYHFPILVASPRLSQWVLLLLLLLALGFFMFMQQNDTGKTNGLFDLKVKVVVT